ncbi:MAG: hypothetical protein ACOYLM_07640 [Methylococcaceae bacterium]|jgi:hypothetical protein
MGNGDRESQSAPLHCRLVYRPIAEEATSQGVGIRWSSNGIEFRGRHPLLDGSAAEVWIEGVKGVSPSWRAFIEVTDCWPETEGGFHIKGWIKGILSDG